MRYLGRILAVELTMAAVLFVAGLLLGWSRLEW